MTDIRSRQWRHALHEIIFEADTPAGKLFDILLIVSIVISVVLVMLDSVSGIRATYGRQLYVGEWVFTILFTVEYLLRLLCVGRPLAYATSFFGMVDLLAILPTYLSIFIPGSQYLLVIRLLRVLRIFRVLKLVPYLGEARLLVQALRASRRKIIVFLFTVMILVVIFGSLMYLIEDPDSGFTSIPRSIYWAIVTLTTVGYGDISPQTGLGQLLAALIMVIGFGMIAVPTGIVTVVHISLKRRFLIRIFIHLISSIGGAAMTMLTRWEPFREMRRLHDLLDRSMDDAWLRQGRADGDLEGPAPIDVYETQDEVVVKAVMPGVKADEINIAVDRDVLTLRGETKSEFEEQDDGRNYHFREIRYNRYGRSLRLPTLVDFRQGQGRVRRRHFDPDPAQGRGSQTEDDHGQVQVGLGFTPIGQQNKKQTGDIRRRFFSSLSILLS